MGTLASLSVLNKDGSCRTVLVHSDGYLRGNGSLGDLLSTTYVEPEEVEAILDLGHLHGLGRTLSSPPPKVSVEDISDYTEAFGRDRGEAGTEAVVYANLLDLRRAMDTYRMEYNYLYVDGDWCFFSEKGDVITLADAIEEDEEREMEELW